MGGGQRKPERRGCSRKVGGGRKLSEILSRKREGGAEVEWRAG